MLSFILTFRRMFRGIWRGLKEPEFQVLFSLAFLTILSGTLFYSRFEDMRWLDALYFSVITLTTIGYGDFVPTTDIGKVFTIGYVITGVGIMVGFITQVFNHLQQARVEEIKNKRKTPPSD
ncbi:two pore domain potassium channel family protein [Exiguobacterium sp. SH1S21]|uniref:potassium channel family protein n=1 Tax=Exiguobacterium sp. SH1S21 TaxID=2510953 RepID=UPI00103950F1|nr:potassium channel family protein [Exiguobacterium sp. SH1S21]TCI53334.1 two pore domain potassium channel family protein [Exiguobacterium sp. SH1S21]